MKIDVPLHRRDRYLWPLAVLLAGGVLAAQMILALRPDSHAAPVDNRDDGFEHRSLVPYSEVIGRYASMEKRLVSELLIDAMIVVESGGNPDAVGKAGERGLLQLKQDTWKLMTAKLFHRELPFSRAFEPEMNRFVARGFLAVLQDYLHLAKPYWNADERSLLLGAYNAGFNRLQLCDYDVDKLPAQTQVYIQRVQELHDAYLREYSHALKAELSPVIEVFVEPDEADGSKLQRS